MRVFYIEETTASSIRVMCMLPLNPTGNAAFFKTAIHRCQDLGSPQLLPKINEISRGRKRWDGAGHPVACAPALYPSEKRALFTLNAGAHCFRGLCQRRGRWGDRLVTWWTCIGNVGRIVGDRWAAVALFRRRKVHGAIVRDVRRLIPAIALARAVTCRSLKFLLVLRNAAGVVNCLDDKSTAEHDRDRTS